MLKHASFFFLCNFLKIKIKYDAKILLQLSVKFSSDLVYCFKNQRQINTCTLYMYIQYGTCTMYYETHARLRCLSLVHYMCKYIHCKTNTSICLHYAPQLVGPADK